MSSLVIKNLPETLHEQLKARARQNHRSLPQEAIALLEAAIAPTHAVHDLQYSDPIEQLHKAGKALTAQGVDLKSWAAQSRDVWR